MTECALCAQSVKGIRALYRRKDDWLANEAFNHCWLGGWGVGVGGWGGGGVLEGNVSFTI